MPVPSDGGGSPLHLPTEATWRRGCRLSPPRSYVPRFGSLRTELIALLLVEGDLWRRRSISLGSGCARAVTAADRARLRTASRCRTRGISACGYRRGRRAAPSRCDRRRGSARRSAWGAGSRSRRQIRLALQGREGPYMPLCIRLLAGAPLITAPGFFVAGMAISEIAGLARGQVMPAASPTAVLDNVENSPLRSIGADGRAGQTKPLEILGLL